MNKYVLAPIILIAIAVSWIVYHFKGENAEWRTPIAFYGKVVDERGMAVSNATVDFSCNDISGTSSYHSKSDTNGLFSISHIRGKMLVVAITKDDYYTSRADEDSFYYAGQNVNFVPNPAKPELFHLRKIGLREPLIHVGAPLGGKKDFRIKRDGTPVEVSLTSGKTVAPGTGDLRVECWTDDEGHKGEHYDWRCRISVPRGGILPYTNEFPFQAPNEGFGDSDEINMPASLENGWGRNAKRSYFLKLANGNYARMTFEMIAGGDHFFEVESFVNPSGSRNLEFDPNKAIELEN
ncbi:MAG TPA: carboxypeptidase-like regulatory domain-containing protein [Verrucomicrobiae bacterium]|nr:carboxypeptidase-like regulatory domain-containing protein [Verrucomicrobiae bacterium]